MCLDPQARASLPSDRPVESRGAPISVPPLSPSAFVVESRSLPEWSRGFARRRPPPISKSPEARWKGPPVRLQSLFTNDRLETVIRYALNDAASDLPGHAPDHFAARFCKNAVIPSLESS